jgi:hypothetical protein
MQPSRQRGRIIRWTELLTGSLAMTVKHGRPWDLPISKHHMVSFWPFDEARRTLQGTSATMDSGQTTKTPMLPREMRVNFQP